VVPVNPALSFVKCITYENHTATIILIRGVLAIVPDVIDRMTPVKKEKYRQKFMSGIWLIVSSGTGIPNLSGMQACGTIFI
jgi:hypothetical protein